MSYPKFNYDDRFTDLEMQKFDEIFQYTDRTGKGQMDVRELGQSMRAMGALISDDEVKLLIRKYDRDNTGFISFTDYKQCMAEIQGKPDSEERIREAF